MIVMSFVMKNYYNSYNNCKSCYYNFKFKRVIKFNILKNNY